jgi:hypothetical protein
MSKQVSALRLRGKALEEMFFRTADHVLIEKKRQLEKTERSLATAAKVSGISSEAVLRKLIEMNVQLDVLATLSIIPLIEVAWADGKVDEEERDAVLRGAESYGILKSQIGYGLLEQWLGHRPPAGLLESWIYYIRGLCPLLSGAERETLKADLIQRARAVAEATGGPIGKKSKISLREHDVLAKLESAFEG